MSLVKVSGNASGTGTLTIASPNTNSDYTLTLPTATTTFVGTDATQTLTNKTIQGGAITSGTAVASTSGTSIDFTSIPSWVKRITVMFSGVSVSGTSAILLQLGTSSGVETSGYLSYTAFSGGTNNTGNSTSTAGFIAYSNQNPNLFYGHIIFTLLGSNTWVGSHILGLNASAVGYSIQGGGNKTTAATLDRVRITTVNGTDTFDAGSINIMYEG